MGSRIKPTACPGALGTSKVAILRDAQGRPQQPALTSAPLPGWDQAAPVSPGTQGARPWIISGSTAVAGAEELGAGGQAVGPSPPAVAPRTLPPAQGEQPEPTSSTRSRAAPLSWGPLAIIGLVVQNIV